MIGWQMKKWFSDIWTFCNHERYQVVSFIVCFVLVFWGVSCQSTVPSIQNPGTQINRLELDLEVEQFVARANARYGDLQQKDELKKLLFDHIQMWTATGTFNPVGLLPAIFSILGVGALTDNVRKRIEIKRSQNSNTPTPS